MAGSLCLDPAGDTTAALRSYFAAELAELPHPYLDDPERLFAWHADSTNREIVLVARDGSGPARRAAAAAESFLGLNCEELKRARFVQYEVIKSFALVIQEVAAGPARDAAVAQLRAAADARSQFAGMTRHFLREWGLLA